MATAATGMDATDPVGNSGQQWDGEFGSNFLRGSEGRIKIVLRSDRTGRNHCREKDSSEH